jgi:flagellar motor switch protein FliN/FliY
MAGNTTGAKQVTPVSLSEIKNSEALAKAPNTAFSQNLGLSLDMMLDVPVTLVFEVGRTSISIKQLMEMNKGSFVELRNVSVDTIDIRINNKIISYGEAIALKSRYGIRFGELETMSGQEAISDD